MLCVVMTNAFSGSVYAFLNTRVFEQPIDTVEALTRALRHGGTTAGTSKGTLLSQMVDVRTQLAEPFGPFGSRVGLNLILKLPIFRILKAMF